MPSILYKIGSYPHNTIFSPPNVMLTILNMSDNHIQTAEKTLRTFIINAEKEALSELLPADA